VAKEIATYLRTAGRRVTSRNQMTVTIGLNSGKERAIGNRGLLLEISKRKGGVDYHRGYFPERGRGG